MLESNNTTSHAFCHSSLPFPPTLQVGCLLQVLHSLSQSTEGSTPPGGHEYSRPQAFSQRTGSHINVCSFLVSFCSPKLILSICLWPALMSPFIVHGRPAEEKPCSSESALRCDRCHIHSRMGRCQKIVLSSMSIQVFSSHIPPFSPWTPTKLLRPLSRWFLSDAIYLNWCYPDSTDSAVCMCFGLKKTDLYINFTTTSFTLHHF